MFPSHFTKDSKRRKTHYEELIDLTKTRNMLMEHSINFLRKIRLKMSIMCIMLMSKMNSLSVIIKL